MGGYSWLDDDGRARIACIAWLSCLACRSSPPPPVTTQDDAAPAPSGIASVAPAPSAPPRWTCAAYAAPPAASSRPHGEPPSLLWDPHGPPIACRIVGPS